MPTAALRACATPGCPARVVRGHCPQHAQVLEHQRGSSNARGYTWQWAKQRAWFLRHYPLCGMRPDGQRPVGSRCAEDGRTTAATVVDHVIPHKGDRRLFEDWRMNWQALCAACHSRKTRSER